MSPLAVLRQRARGLRAGPPQRPSRGLGSGRGAGTWVPRGALESSGASGTWRDAPQKPPLAWQGTLARDPELPIRRARWARQRLGAGGPGSASAPSFSRRAARTARYGPWKSPCRRFCALRRRLRPGHPLRVSRVRRRRRGQPGWGPGRGAKRRTPRPEGLGAPRGSPSERPPRGPAPGAQAGSSAEPYKAEGASVRADVTHATARRPSPASSRTSGKAAAGRAELWSNAPREPRRSGALSGADPSDVSGAARARARAPL